MHSKLHRLAHYVPTVPFPGESPGPLSASVLCDFAIASGHGLLHVPSSAALSSCWVLPQCPFRVGSPESYCPVMCVGSLCAKLLYPMAPAGCTSPRRVIGSSTISALCDSTTANGYGLAYAPFFATSSSHCVLPQGPFMRYESCCPAMSASCLIYST